MSIYWTALLLGLAGSLHCAAMCGPIIMSLPKSAKPLLYHLGRTSSYVLIGLVFGLAGHALKMVLIQQYLSIFAGGLILTLLAVKIFPGLIPLQLNLTPLWLKFKASILPALKTKPKFVVSFGLGLLNGFLPCGLVYIAAAAAFGIGNIGRSLLYMLMFSLGTLPMMLGINLSGRFLPGKLKLSLNKLSPFFILLIGCLFVVRGMALNIPYLSPGIAENGKSIKTCCKACHKH